MKAVHLRLFSIMAVLGVLVTACGSSAPASPPKTAPSVKTGEATVNGHQETVLVNSAGRTLYILTGSTTAHLECTGSCTSAWPPLLLKGKAPTTADGISGVAVAATADGPIAVFHGHPLFLYTGDQKPGEANGEGIQMGPGEVWDVATPSLSAQAPTTSAKRGGSGSSSSNTSGSGSSGYNY